jgi:isoleucyl-tRNA synthetase
VLGPRFGQDVGRVRGALEVADPAAIVRAMRAGQPIEVAGFTLAATDVLVSVEAAEGWAAQEEGGYVALIDTRVTPGLAAEGMAREVVRRLQDLRRDASLDVTDRIHVTYEGDSLSEVMAAHGDYIAAETLALSLDDAPPPDGATRFEGELEGVPVVLSVRKA